ncbi:hypothetical protein KEM54_005107 [Ascosphaera aggregata]|nr:hypothetical protein KEM54_005107 [Ascosphaera aggregata]
MTLNEVDVFRRISEIQICALAEYIFGQKAVELSSIKSELLAIETSPTPFCSLAPEQSRGAHGDQLGVKPGGRVTFLPFKRKSIVLGKTSELILPRGRIRGYDMKMNSKFSIIYVNGFAGEIDASQSYKDREDYKEDAWGWLLLSGPIIYENG